MLTEKGQMVMTNRKMQIHNGFLTIFSRSNAVLRTLHEVLQSRCTRTVTVLMEEQQTFRQFPIMHVVQKVTNGFLTFLASELRTESKTILVSQEILNERRLDAVLQVLEEVLEHTACSTRSRDELEDLVSLLQILLPSVDVLLLLGTLRSQDALFRRSRSYDIQLRKTRSEAF